MRASWRQKLEEALFANFDQNETRSCDTAQVVIRSVILFRISDIIFLAANRCKHCNSTVSRFIMISFLSNLNDWLIASGAFLVGHRRIKRA